MKENPERMFGGPGKIDRKAPQSYTDKRVTFMAETGEAPIPPKEKQLLKPAEELKSKKNRLSQEESKKIYEPRIKASTDPDEIQTLKIMMEEGIPPISGGAFNPSDPDNYENSVLKFIARRLQNPLEPTILQSRMEEVQRVIASGQLNDNDVNAAEQLLSSLEDEQISQALKARTAQDRFGFYLQAEDIQVLMNQGPTKWLDDQFDILYRSVQEGQELTSPVINNLQTVVSEAIRWLQYHGSPEELDRFQTLFIQRLKLMTMRTYIGYRAIGEVKNAASQLGAHGLLSGFGMEEGRVTPMFNRLNELLDDERLKTALRGHEFGHVTPEIANQLQEKVIQEQIKFAELGIGDFMSEFISKGKNYKDLSTDEQEGVRADIIRAVRIAYDVFVDTQRQAVIVARGRHLHGTENYFSDPASGPLNVYNFEDLLTEKFDLFNRPEYEFLNRIKLDLANGYIKKKREDKQNPNPKFDLSDKDKLDLGRRLFRDLFAVPDFFSSGWRIEGIVTSIEERFIARFVDPSADDKTKDQQITDAKDNARNMALFLRLKGAEDKYPESWQIGKRDAWERIAKYRPEEIVRLFRERVGGEVGLEAKLSDLFSNPIFTTNGVNNYDQFKEKYGSIIRVIRDRGYKEFRTIDIGRSGFTAEERTLIGKYFAGNGGEADSLQQMFRLMTTFSEGSISDLLTNNKFEDIYTRTIDANDAILNELEKTETTSIYKDANGNNIIKKVRGLSRRWAADQGGDALIRNWSDTENAVGAGEALMHFIKAEKQDERLKASLEFADKTSRYTSQLHLAKCLRYTFGTFLITSKKDFGWEIIGLGKLPFRQAMSEIERIYGPSAVPKSRDELRQIIDEISSRLEGSLTKDAREGKLKPKDFKKALEEAKIYEEDLVDLTENTKGDIIKRKGLSILFYIILALLLEGQRTVREAAKGAA